VDGSRYHRIDVVAWMHKTEVEVVHCEVEFEHETVVQIQGHYFLIVSVVEKGVVNQH
jgi:hypothetical protein